MKLLYESTAKDESGLLLLRSKIKATSRRIKFPETLREKIELVCNEIVTNQQKHANGSGMVQLWEAGENPSSLDLFALDYGPGIPDIEQAKKDGNSTAGTMGKGLGAIERLSSNSAIYTVTEGSAAEHSWHGTAIWARFSPGKKKQHSPIETGVYLRPFQDCFYNGDYISLKNGSSRIKWLHMDGLGHGKQAAEAVGLTNDIMERDIDLKERLETLSRQMASGRGAVGLIAEIDASSGNAAISGIGDMNAYLICNGERKHFPLAAGILGHQHRSIDVLDFRFPDQALFITASDGIRSRWNLSTLPQLWRLHPQIIALVMGHVLGRNNDDRSLVVIRKTPK